MALNANALVTLPQAKGNLGETSSANDEIIERQINALSLSFESGTGRKLKQQTLTDYRVNGNSKTYLFLPFVPVQSVSKVEIRYSINDSIYKTITDTSKFLLKDKRTGILQLKEDSFVCGVKNILVTMSVGYLATDGELAQAQALLLTQLKFDYNKWQHNEIGVTSRTLQDGSIGFVTGSQFLKEVREGLEALQDRRVLVF